MRGRCGRDAGEMRRETCASSFGPSSGGFFFAPSGGGSLDGAPSAPLRIAAHAYRATHAMCSIACGARMHMQWGSGFSGAPCTGRTAICAGTASGSGHRLRRGRLHQGKQLPLEGHVVRGRVADGRAARRARRVAQHRRQAADEAGKDLVVDLRHRPRGAAASAVHREGSGAMSTVGAVRVRGSPISTASSSAASAAGTT